MCERGRVVARGSCLSLEEKRFAAGPGFWLLAARERTPDGRDGPPDKLDKRNLISAAFLTKARAHDRPNDNASDEDGGRAGRLVVPHSKEANFEPAIASFEH